MIKTTSVDDLPQRWFLPPPGGLLAPSLGELSPQATERAKAPLCKGGCHAISVTGGLLTCGNISVRFLRRGTFLPPNKKVPKEVGLRGTRAPARDAVPLGIPRPHRRRCSYALLPLRKCIPQEFTVYLSITAQRESFIGIAAGDTQVAPTSDYGNLSIGNVGAIFDRPPKAPLCKGSCHIADFRQYD